MNTINEAVNYGFEDVDYWIGHSQKKDSNYKNQ